MDIYHVAIVNLKKQMIHSFWQGILKVFVLHQAAQGPIYGGKLKKQLQGWGYDISPGSLYPLLHAFEKGHLFRSRVKIFKGRARKYYEITDQGRAVLAEVQQELNVIMTRLLSPGRPPSGANHPLERSPL
jgi:DNA-binding PadR family transcriptional regulator